MKQRNWSEGILPAIIVIYGIAYVAQTHQLPWNAILYPYVLMGMIAMLLGLVALRQRARGDQSAPDVNDTPSAQEDQPPFGKLIAGSLVTAGSLVAAGRVLSVVVGTFAYPLIMESLGFVMTTGLYLAALFQIFRAFHPVVIVPLALAISGILSVFLQQVLVLNLPSFGFADLPFGI